MQETIAKILEIDVDQVIGRYISLKKKGTSYEACCPFHNEKTPSFKVSPAKGIWKCFGCGMGGNAISFVMEHEKLRFVDAIIKIAKDHNIKYEYKEPTDEERKERLQRESLIIANKSAAGYYEDNLFQSKNALALEYVLSRFDKDSIAAWQIGYASDDWHAFQNHAHEKGFKDDILISAGLISESSTKKGKLFDRFRNRIMFPIHDRSGMIVGFSGRIMPDTKDKSPKYINTPESQVYTKGKMLYGMSFAWRDIRNQGKAILVEGNPDVIRMHEIGVRYTIGTCGTSLTVDQVNEIKRGCDSIIIIGDGDKAGRSAMLKSGEKILKAGMFCNIIPLPDGEDPDSFFQGKTKDEFDEYAKENLVDYIEYLAREKKNKAKKPDFKSKLIEDICDLIIRLPETTHDMYVDIAGGILDAKKIIKDRMKDLKKDIVKEEKARIPADVKLSDAEEYGFYEYGGCYFFRTNKGYIRGSNFTMKPLFHVQSVLNAKRLYEIRNEHGYSQVIELAQKDLVALARFKERVESLGNFLWEAGEVELNKLKRYLYENTESCVEISQLGWQKIGFWAWGNGIYNGDFNKVNEYGISKHEDVNYYLPAFSKIYRGEEGLYVSERRFIHHPGQTTLHDICQQMISVFGENAIVAVCFYIATLFRDHIVKIFNFFPLLNLFGPKGTGKTELAVTLLQFFGKQGKGPNINNTSKPALADHVAQVSNALVHIDEYKNNIDFEKIEFLKGLWDGTGRTRMNMDKDKKKETTAVDSGIILTGQEMPTADIALFSRLVYLTFNKTNFTEEEKKRYRELKDTEKRGLTHITHELMNHRDVFIKNYSSNYSSCLSEIQEAMGGMTIEDRTLINWVIVLASYRTLKDLLQVSFDYDTACELFADRIKTQNKATLRSNDISQFWDMVEYLSREGLIENDVDYKIMTEGGIKTDKIDTMWRKEKNVLYMDHTKIFMLYRKHGRQANINILPIQTLEYYIKNDERYLGKKLSVRFKVKHPQTGAVDFTDSSGQVARRITTAFAFDYDELNISLSTVNVYEHEESVDNEPIKALKEREEAPF